RALGSPDSQRAVAFEPRAHVAERVEVRVEPAAPDEVAPGWRHPSFAETGEQRSGEQEGRPDAFCEVLVDGRGGDAVSAQADLVPAAPPHGHPEALQHRD